MGKRKQKKYYNSSKGNKKGRYQMQTLQTGMKGFLITCASKTERETKGDSYALLNKFADELYGPEKLEGKEDKEGGDSDADDIEKELQAEIEDIKTTSKSVSRRFQAVTTGTHNCLFIKTSLDNPVELINHIVSHLQREKTKLSRYIMKIFPVMRTCRCDEEKIRALTSECLTEVFKDQKDFSYCFTIKIRNNTGMTKSVILPIMVDAFSKLGFEDSKVVYNGPDYVISVDVIKSVFCLSVLKDYVKYKKYNLQEIVKTEAESAEKEETVCDDDNNDDKVVDNDDDKVVDNDEKIVVDNDNDEKIVVDNDNDDKLVDNVENKVKDHDDKVVDGDNNDDKVVDGDNNDEKVADGDNNDDKVANNDDKVADNGNASTSQVDCVEKEGNVSTDNSHNVDDKEKIENKDLEKDTATG